MTASRGRQAPSAVGAADVDLAGERLFETLAAACEAQRDFVGQVQAALRAGLTLLASEPALARLLSVEAYFGDEVLMEARGPWLQRYGDLLRRAAHSSPQATTYPPFLEPALIGSIFSTIARETLAERSERLQSLVPDFLEFVLVYYLTPGETGPIVRAVREGEE